MQVLSSRFNASSRSSSTSRTTKKGLSLTSRTKCNSLPKPSHQLLSDQTCQSVMHSRPNNQSQVSIKLNLAPSTLTKPSSFMLSQQTVERSMGEMPKITFHYSTEPVLKNFNVQKTNPFLGQHPMSYIAQQPIRGRFLPCQQLRNVVIQRSVQTKNLSRKKINSQHYLQQSNQKKTLIDSRIINRQIISEEVYQSMPSVSYNTIQTISYPHKNQVSSISINSTVCPNTSSEKIHVKPFLEQPQSPYHLLVSTAHKCESKQLSPSVINEQNKVLKETSTLNKNPPIQQFNVYGVVIEENQQESASSSRIFQQTNLYQRISPSHDQQTLFQALQQTLTQIQTQKQCKTLILHQNNNILQSKEVNVSQNKVSFSPEKVTFVQKKHVIQTKSKQQKDNSVLSDIENRPPESHQAPPISGRRNIKRFREIEKRLEEIITICSSNL